MLTHTHFIVPLWEVLSAHSCLHITRLNNAYLCTIQIFSCEICARFEDDLAAASPVQRWPHGSFTFTSPFEDDNVRAKNCRNVADSTIDPPEMLHKR